MFSGKVKRLMVGLSIVGAVCVSGVAVLACPPVEDMSIVGAVCVSGVAVGEGKGWCEIIKRHDKAIEIDPRNALAYGRRGHAKDKLNQHFEAIKDYDKAIEIDPRNALAYGSRAIAKEALGQKASADKDRAIAEKLRGK